MPTLEDRALTPDPYAQFKAYKEQRMKSIWFRVIWSGALLIIFGLSLAQRLETAQRTDSTTTLYVVTALVLARFGYYLWRAVKAHRDVEAMKRSLGLAA